MRGAVVFDVDGTLLDSAPGIVAGFRAALVAMGIEPPADDILGADLGPPVGQVLADFGVPADDIPAARAAYRDFYRREGLQASIPYVGVRDMLEKLRGRGIRLGTATAKRTDTAELILSHHRLDDLFDVINGSTDEHPTKAETLAETVRQLGTSPGPTIWMVGDRRSDIEAAHSCRVRSVGALWGYGSHDELAAAGADLLATSPTDCAGVLGPALSAASHSRPANR